jgi:hypothetical protein
MSKSKSVFLDKFTRKASKVQKQGKRSAEVRIMKEERIEYVSRGIRIKGM